MAAFPVILFLIFSHTLASPAKSLWEYGFALVDHSYQLFIAKRLASCYMACNMQPACQSLNYNLADKTCEFNNDTKYFRPKYFVEKLTSVYADNPESGKLVFLFRYQISNIMITFIPLYFILVILIMCAKNELAIISDNQRNLFVNLIL